MSANLPKIPAVAPEEFWGWDNSWPHPKEIDYFGFIKRIYGVEPNRVPLYLFHMSVLDKRLERGLHRALRTDRRFSSDILLHIRYNYDQFLAASVIGYEFGEYWAPYRGKTEGFHCVAEEKTVFKCSSDLFREIDGALKKDWAEKEGRFYYEGSFQSFFDAKKETSEHWKGSAGDIFVTGNHVRPELLPWPDRLRRRVSYGATVKAHERAVYEAHYGNLEKREVTPAQIENAAQFFLDEYGQSFLKGAIFTHQLRFMDAFLLRSLNALFKQNGLMMSDYIPTEGHQRREVWLETFEAPLPQYLEDLPPINLIEGYEMLKQLAGLRYARRKRSSSAPAT